MVVNTVGAVPIFDGNNPRTFSAACGVGVTGGQLVYCSGAVGVVSSGADSFVAGDVVIAGVASGATFNGIVITPGNTSSGTNNFVSVATNGMYLLTADGNVFGGTAVGVAGVDSVTTLLTAGSQGLKIGRALTGAVSGTSNYCLVQLTP